MIRSLVPPNHRLINDRWSQKMIALADAHSDLLAKTVSDPGDIGDTLISSSWVMAARGGVGSHTDPTFDEFFYLFILKADKSVLKTYGHAPIDLVPGMIIEFSAHRRHSLKQRNKNSILAWLQLESDKRMSITAALKHFKQNSI